MARRPVQPADDRFARRHGEPSLGIVSVSENALAVIFWQPVQWQAEASSGGAFTAIRVLPQRQPPAQGSFQSCIFCSSITAPRKRPLSTTTWHGMHSARIAGLKQKQRRQK